VFCLHRVLAEQSHARGHSERSARGQLPSRTHLMSRRCPRHCMTQDMASLGKSANLPPEKIGSLRQDRETPILASSWQVKVGNPRQSDIGRGHQMSRFAGDFMPTRS
jgi:hypothetical protein